MLSRGEEAREGLFALGVAHMLLASIHLLGAAIGWTLLKVRPIVDVLPPPEDPMNLPFTVNWGPESLVYVPTFIGLSLLSSGLLVLVGGLLLSGNRYGRTLGLANAALLTFGTVGATILSSQPPWIGTALYLLFPATTVALLLGSLAHGFGVPFPSSGARLRPSPSWTSAIPILVAATVILIAGHRFFWFICDDAYIAFRYISNHQLGYGYVWNPPPFRPVEGYTSFLWIVLLDKIWTFTGLDPTRTANWVSLFFSFLSTLLVAKAAWSLPLRGGLRNAKLPALALILLGVVTNRTWLIWSTSGLETALFVFLLLAWLLSITQAQNLRTLTILWVTASAMALTRPDGLLYLGATACAWICWILYRRQQTRAVDLLSASPAALVVLHLVWRHNFYGWWLPNTYYAKHVHAWPEAGIAFISSFFLEYAAWLPLGLILIALRNQIGEGWRPNRSWLFIQRTGLVVTPIVHLAYYLLRVGGDHFEYRILVHWVPILFLGAAWALDRAFFSRRVAIACLTAVVLLSWPLPWGDYILTRHKIYDIDTVQLSTDLSPVTPVPLQGYSLLHDLIQRYLQAHFVSTRYQAHVLFVDWQQKRYPSREEGQQISKGIPVLLSPNVGVPGWNLPHVAIIDVLGLNDLVVARTPPPPGHFRAMAHERVAPPAYYHCFDANVSVHPTDLNTFRFDPRTLPASRVIECETHFLSEVLDHH